MVLRFGQVLAVLVHSSLPNASMQAEDWAFCRESLQRHSRTFAIPIAMLPAVLERAVTCSYLLCRIADTVEDTPDWNTRDKQRLYRRLQDALDEGANGAAFVAAVRELPGGDPAERQLLLGLDSVLRVFHTLATPLRTVCTDGVLELIGGMMIFSRRTTGHDGIRCLSSEADLERYCYFVAGVIGRLLTDAFLLEMPQVSSDGARAMRAHAESFGTGLQMVNILRDMSNDLQRGVCFVPRTLFDKIGIPPAELCEPQHEVTVRRMLEPLFDAARRHLDAAFEYTVAIPTEATAIRRFCLVPLWLAVATLELCRRHPALLRPGQLVKLSRTRVMELINVCVAASGDNERLAESYASLGATSPVEAA